MTPTIEQLLSKDFVEKDKSSLFIKITKELDCGKIKTILNRKKKQYSMKNKRTLSVVEWLA